MQHLNLIPVTQINSATPKSDAVTTETHKVNNNKLLTSFLLLNAMIGAGILNQAYVFKVPKINANVHFIGLYIPSHF